MAPASAFAEACAADAARLIPVAFEPEARSVIHVAARPADMMRVRMPTDLAKAETKARKTSFLGTVLPLVHDVNARIAADRQHLLSLQAQVARGCALTGVDQSWLEELAFAYDVEPTDLKELVLRVDTVPLSLAAAQAAIESAWGTSRFLLEGNALFGERTYDSDVPGMKVPGRTAFRVRSFDTLYTSVLAYVRLLNTQPKYATFRTLRAAMRTDGKALDGLALAPTLDFYSEERGVYTAKVREVIRFNEFQFLDTASGPAATLVATKGE